MTFDHMREAFLRLRQSKDEQIDREISQRLYEMAQTEGVQRWMNLVEQHRQQWYPAPSEFYQRSVRRLWRQPSEPLVSAGTAAWLEEQFQR